MLGINLKGKHGDPARLGTAGSAVLAGGVEAALLVRPNEAVEKPVPISAW
jgi:hypothetical protein